LGGNKVAPPNKAGQAKSTGKTYTGGNKASTGAIGESKPAGFGAGVKTVGGAKSANSEDMK
jgi:hypothetical protein